MDTPANGGSHRAAPPRNLGIRTGQRPTIHRLQRCRGHNGPRASITTARGTRPGAARGGTAHDQRWATTPIPEAGERMTRTQHATRHGEAAYLAGKRRTVEEGSRQRHPPNGQDDADLPRPTPGTTGKGCASSRRRLPKEDLDFPCSHIYSPTTPGHAPGGQTFPGPGPAGGGRLLYGVVRALGRFPIQSGPLRFAHFSDGKGPSRQSGGGSPRGVRQVPLAPGEPWSSPPRLGD